MRKAVIDVGTNSTRLAVAEQRETGFVMIFTEVAEVRLGEGMGSEQKIQPIPLQRNIEVIQRFLQKAQELMVDSVRIIATSALREAKNQEIVKTIIEEATGFPIEILSGEKEAKLSYLGASGDFKALCCPLAVLDIGGGSTELVYSGETTMYGTSVPVGAVRLQEHPEMIEHLRQTLENLKEHSLPKNCILIAVGGTNTCLMALEQKMSIYDGMKIHGQILTRQQVNDWCKKLFSMTQEEREQLPGMKRNRADIMPYGVKILQTVLELLDMEKVVVSDKGLVYGILLRDFQK